MAEKDQPKPPTHTAYSVIRREGEDDFWLNVGLVFQHKDGAGFNVMLQAFPLDGQIVCRAITEKGDAQDIRGDASRSRDDQMRRERPSRTARR